jgi:KUP system potassium uptake protein
MVHNNKSNESAHTKGSLAAIGLAALGVVFGDIGTSPLYALRESIQSHGTSGHAMTMNADSIFGMLSLVFWILIFTVSIKYVIFVLSADNRGEGGILALTSLACPKRFQEKRPILLGIGLFGAALLYGDGLITPAISVLSAVEGLKEITPIFGPYVVPITVMILVFLFLIQKQGTGKIGKYFGPIILLWFVVIGVLGFFGILRAPEILGAINPYYAFHFCFSNPANAFHVMGSLFLVVTGGEALYADMGHFGKKPIQLGWFSIALPGLILNYFGQGALLLSDPKAADGNIFFLLVPTWMLYPMVLLATLAAVIASQALITGVFSLTHQAIQLGFSPRLQTIHTSSQEKGQIYMPQVNYAMLVGTVWLVLTFKSSSNLAAAYGIAVSATMIITTILMYVVMQRIFKWSALSSMLVCGSFLVIDIIFFSANALKMMQGGWVSIALGLIMFVCMTTWRSGRKVLFDRLRRASIPMDEFISLVKSMKLAKVPGTAIFMVGDAKTTPPAMVHNVKHNKVIHESNVILTVLTEEVPSVPERNRFVVEQVSAGFYRVTIHYGFMDAPNVPLAMAKLRDVANISIDLDEATYFLGRETIIATENPGMAIWREHLFAFMSRNAQRATQFFDIPANQVIEVGMQVEI